MICFCILPFGLIAYCVITMFTVSGIGIEEEIALAGHFVFLSTMGRNLGIIYLHNPWRTIPLFPLWNESVHYVVDIKLTACVYNERHSPIARIRHFEENLDLKMIWIDVLPNGSIHFQNQWPCKWCIRCQLCDECILNTPVTYLAASPRLFLMQTMLSPQMADRVMGEWWSFW